MEGKENGQGKGKGMCKEDLACLRTKGVKVYLVDLILSHLYRAMLSLGVSPLISAGLSALISSLSLPSVITSMIVLAK